MKFFSTQEETRQEAMDKINELGLTVDDIMELTGFSKATVNKFLKGKHVAGSTICEIRNRVINCAW